VGSEVTTSEAKWDGFVANLNTNQRRALAYIKTHDGVTLDEMAAALANEKNNTIAGWLTGIIRHAKNAGIRHNMLIRRDETGRGRDRVVRYYVGSLLRANEVPEA
jgi:hypothetical protein